MNRQIDFRRNGTQVIDLPFSGVSKIEYIGKCVVTGIRLYVSDTGNDPRGPLGQHAVQEFIASEYNMRGKTIYASWLACNNDSTIYQKALLKAKSHWQEI